MKINTNNSFKYIFIVVFISIIATVVYNYKLNNSIKLIEENIHIDNLSSEFQGFKILQITDLHSKEFGKMNSKLVDLINNIDYDIIVFTGDMANSEEDDYSIFYNLVNGIERNEQMYYVSGNNGPFVFENEELRFYYSDKELIKSDVGKELEGIGIKLMDDVHKVQRGDSTLWISEMISNKEFYQKASDYREGDIRIAITHYPMNENYYEGIAKIYNKAENNTDEIKNHESIIPQYDLILSGHYHGGQWRLPFIGAFFISDINGDGWFPDEERVSGLTEWGGFKQYVSRGLGASGNPLVRFRLFNQPEINLITLEKS